MRLPNPVSVKVKVILIIIFASIVCGLVWSKESERIKYTGTFTNLRYIPDTGDISGQELHIMYTTNGYQGVFQIAEGAPEPLMLVTIRYQRNQLYFEFGKDKNHGQFDGKILRTGIKGTLKYDQGGNEEIYMKRAAGYWD